MGWLHREYRASVIPAVSLANPGGGWLTQGPTASGVTVTETTAQKLSAVNACRQILAETMATTSLHLKQRLPRGDVRFATDHPLYDVLATVACPDLPGRPAVTAFALREFMQAGLAIQGRAYAQKIFDRRGRIVGLNPLRPDHMMVNVLGGRVQYLYQRDDGPAREFRPDELLRLHYCLDSDAVTPISPIRANAEALGIAIAVNRYSGTFFANGAAIAGVFEHPGKIGEEAFGRLNQQLKDRTVSGGKGHAGLILEQGMSWKGVSVNPEDAQALESRAFSIREICRIYRIPPHMVADLENATFSNIEYQGIQFAQYTMMPWFERWEQAIQLDLLTPEERAAGYFVDFDVNELTRGDTAAQNAAYIAGRQWGYLSANDVRREQGKPLLGPEGDVYLTPVNMIPADQVAELTGKTPPSAKDAPAPPAEPAAEPTAEPDQRAARAELLHARLSRQYRPLFEEAFGRIVAREAKDVRRIAKRHLDAKGATDFPADLDAVATDCSTFGERALRAVVSSAFEAHAMAEAELRGTVGHTPDPNGAPWASKLAREVAESRAKSLKIAVREAVFGSPIEVASDKIEAILATDEARAASTWAEKALEMVVESARIAAKSAVPAA